MDQKTMILEAAIEAFNQKGLKFTMDDLSKLLSMSKKTLYVNFKDKETLFCEMVDYIFDSIKASQKEVLEDESLSLVDKIKNIMGVMPESYNKVDFKKLYLLKDKYPTIYKKVEHRLETGWDETIALLEKGIQEGTIRNVNIGIVKMMFEASLEQFFQRDILQQCNLSYSEALTEVVDIIMKGIIGV